jgi:hypothetical protein
LFVGGLQLNWVWSKRLPYTHYVVGPGLQLVPEEANVNDVRSDFYITFDW